MNLLRWIKEHAFVVDSNEVTFARLGFEPGDVDTQQRLETVARTFVSGVNTALRETNLERLAESLDATAAELRGFAFEGAAMGLTLMDKLAPWRSSRLQSFIAGPARSYTYLAYIGAGVALARMRSGVEGFRRNTDPVLSWLAVDGYGFHEGFFRTHQAVRKQKIPGKLKGYARRAFDQGLGRSLWFINCADPHRIAACVAAFPPARHADLWSGLGLACAYAGGVPESTIAFLRDRAGMHASQMAQGAAFAALARLQVGNPAPHTDLACRILCNCPADAAGRMAVTESEHLPLDAEEPSYEIWRRRLHAQFDLADSLYLHSQPAANAG